MNVVEWASSALPYKKKTLAYAYPWPSRARLSLIGGVAEEYKVLGISA